MLRLMLFRHAKSDWPAGVADRERPLAPRGRRAAPVMGTYMVRSGLTPSQVLVSPARRTLETWAAACDSWASPPPTTYEEAIYEAAPEMLLDVVRRRGTDSPLMLVGHNPGLESLTSRLVAAADRARLPVKFPTGGLAVIDLPAKGWAEVGPGTGTLERFVTPRSLEAEED
ncbi:SixA phosphatase family protein [Ancylobacter defluvii]|uniref:Phosphoglycerate mutase n=1 Tax=Ancylobacter defluvii TaxID=1282440 RepID=A0A9W6N9K9_9HYPH|nr:histidine phosphatase family protein [Ancylobacter defluvii]MBS7587731.1 histidine phosphatase family protein [Ancylobacter defluvii]GLK82541.1 phosphoglycerate mutase [Ancylobacter defluvii]